MSSHILYINSIDECVANIIDTFYIEIIEDKSQKKLLTLEYSINNFNNLKRLIKKIIDKSIEKYNIIEIITNKTEFDKIIILFNNYVLLYYFFFLGYTNNLNDILDTLNKLNNKYQDDFFRNRYLTQYGIYYKYIKDYQIVFNNFNKINDPSFITDYSDVIKSLNLMNSSIIQQISENKDYLQHNILKIIIFREIYMIEDKLIIFKILENEEFNTAEYKYIEIIDAKYDLIDYSTIESLFSVKDIKQGVAEDVYNMIQDYEISGYIKDYSVDMKINSLFKNKILIPITDDFLRYHKDSEMYDKSSVTTIDPKDKTNKKDNTKVRYIITKMNKLKDLYSPKILADPLAKSEVEKYFYQPMIYRKIVIINDIEEVNILKKLNIKNKNINEISEFFEDLIQIRNYPYIDFRFTENDSFIFSPNNTIQAIRYCNFEYKNDQKFTNILRSNIQYRVINNKMKANIVGVAIPKYNFLHNYNETILGCNLLKNTMDMSLLNKNSFAVTMKKIRKLFLEDRRYSKLLYWIFNKKNDKIKLDFFDNIKQLPKDEYIKLLLGKIYDEIVEITFQLIYNDINRFDKIDIGLAKEIIRSYEKKLVLIPRQSQKYAELMKLIYYIKAEIDDNIYDKLEDKIPELNIKLPKIILEKIKLHVIKILKQELTTDITNDIDIYEGYLCQHTITWNAMIKYRKTNPNKFNQDLFNFIKKYVIENKEKDFICKSCYQLIDLRNYTTSIYPGSDSFVVSFGLETELETIPEYMKYTKAIKNMDKIVEKICYSANIYYFVGTALEIKFRRQEIIKNIIDLIDIQYRTLFSKETQNRKERLDNAIKKYGCSMSNFFLFKLENDIFTYSSKETDKFKLFKMNNILVYIMIGIILEINLSQILFLNFDKLVNYFLFIKFGFNLFDNLYIRISNKNDIAPIKNYKLLCYVIYYISGIFAKFNMFYVDNITYKPNHINPQVQRFAIHTFIDAINSILEVNTREDKNYLYTIFATKFFNKLNTIYDNNSSKDVIERLDNQFKKKVVITDNKFKYNVSIIDAIPLKPYNFNFNYMMESSLGIKEKILSYPSVKFTLDKLKDNIIREDIREKLYLEILAKISSIYDKDGLKRNIELTLEEANKIPLEEQKKIYKKSREVRIKSDLKLLKKTEYRLEKINIKFLQNTEYLEKIKKQYKDDIQNVINNFINKLESLIGKDININNANYYLNYDIYEIVNDYRGNKKTPIFISEKDGKIKFRRDEPIFKQDVYYYLDSSNNVTVYYSAIEKYLIGYKEASRDYVILKNTDCYLKIHYSIYNQLRYFGFNYLNYRLEPKIIMKDYVNNILMMRLQNLKNSLSSIQQIIYQVKNHFRGSNLNPVAKYYQSKIKNIETYDEEGDRIFNDWNSLVNYLYFYKLDINTTIITKILPNSNEYLQTDILLKFITNDDIILYYIIQQFNMLLDINNDSYTKVNIAYLIINIIIQLFKNFTQIENTYYDINVKKFYNFIMSKAEISEIHDDIDYSSMTEEELEKLKEEQDIDRERIDALDADQVMMDEEFDDEEVLLYDRSGDDY